jgi:hypothetical protein
VLAFVSNDLSVTVFSLFFSELFSNAPASLTLGEFFLPNVKSVELSVLGDGVFGLAVRSGCYTGINGVCSENGVAETTSLLIARLLMPAASNLLSPQPVIFALTDLKVLENSTVLRVRGMALDVSLKFRCSVESSTPQNLAINCSSDFSTVNLNSFSDQLVLSSVSLGPDLMLLEGGRWPFFGFNESLSVKFPRSFVPDNFLSLSVVLNRSQSVVFALTPTIGSSLGGYVITFSGAGLNHFGDLMCRVGLVFTVPLNVKFSIVLCPVLPSMDLLNSAELLSSNGTSLYTCPFFRTYGLERETSSLSSFSVKEENVQLEFLATARVINANYNLTATNALTGDVVFRREFLVTSSPQFLVVGINASSFGLGVFIFTLKCPVGCHDYTSIVLSTVDLIANNDSVYGSCSTLAGATVTVPSIALPSWIPALYSSLNSPFIFVRPLLAMTPSSRFVTIVSSNTMVGPTDSARCMLGHSSSRFSVRFKNSAPLITSIDHPFVGQIQGLYFKSFRLVLAGQLPQFPFNVSLFSSRSEDNRWQVMSQDSSTNTLFMEGSVFTHYALILPQITLLDLRWSFYGSNDRSKWMLLDEHQLHNISTGSNNSFFSLSQPYPIVDIDSPSSMPWILSHIPGFFAPLPFISSSYASSLHIQSFGSFSLSVWLNPLNCTMDRCCPLLITDRSAYGPVVFIELLPLSRSSAPAQMFAFRVCSIVLGVSRCSSVAQLGTLINSGIFSLISVTFDMGTKEMSLFLNGQLASQFVNDIFPGLNISNFVVGLGYSGRVDDVVIVPYIINSADLLFQFPVFGVDPQAVLLQMGDDMHASIKIFGTQRASFGLSEFGQLQFSSQISVSKTGSALYNFHICHESAPVSFGILGTAVASGCQNRSTLTCSFDIVDVLTSPVSSAAYLRVDISSGSSITVPVSIFSSVMTIRHFDVMDLSPASQIFLSGTLWKMNCSGIDSAYSHFAVLHGSMSMVVFPCSLLSNSSPLMICNSSHIHRLSTAHSDNLVLWQPLADASLYVSLISVGIHQHISVGLQGQMMPHSDQVVSRILSLHIFCRSGKMNYGVVVKLSEHVLRVVLVYQDYPSPRLVELAPVQYSSCLSSTYVTSQNGKLAIQLCFRASHFCLTQALPLYHSRRVLVWGLTYLFGTLPLNR